MFPMMDHWGIESAMQDRIDKLQAEVERLKNTISVLSEFVDDAKVYRAALEKIIASDEGLGVTLDGYVMIDIAREAVRGG